jgi:beta-glucosidase
MAIDRNAQEDARHLVWNGSDDGAAMPTAAPALKISRENNGGLAIEMDVRVDEVGRTMTQLAMKTGDTNVATVAIGPILAALSGKG